MGKKYRIHVMESERGWGQDRWTETFDTYSEALARINAINANNTARNAPDWYQVAYGKIDVIDDGVPDENS